MRALLASELLDVWERGLTLSPIERSLTLLAVAGNETLDNVAQLAVGVRDALLLDLREMAFGEPVAAVERCPNCGERLELNFSTSDVKAEAELKSESSPSLSLQVNGYEFECRAANSLDIMAIAGQRDPVAARRQLLEGCLLKKAENGDPVAIEQLPDEVLAAIAERLQQADPQASVQLALICPQCNHQWQSDFDIGSFFWDEIHVWAQRILREVHVLATAYGWREMDILNMSPWRRQFYLNCIGR